MDYNFDERRNHQAAWRQGTTLASQFSNMDVMAHRYMFHKIEVDVSTCMDPIKKTAPNKLRFPSIDVNDGGHQNDSENMFEEESDRPNDLNAQPRNIPAATIAGGEARNTMDNFLNGHCSIPTKQINLDANRHSTKDPNGYMTARELLALQTTHVGSMWSTDKFSSNFHSIYFFLFRKIRTATK